MLDHACRHNVASWQGGDYIGVGPGAHGRVSNADGRSATQAVKDPQSWLAAVDANGHGWATMQKLDAEDMAAEAVMLGLRLIDGLALADLEARGVRLDAARLARGRADGLLTSDKTRLQASPKGRLYWIIFWVAFWLNGGLYWLDDIDGAGTASN